MSDLVHYDLNGRIASLTMDDGKVNAFSIPMLEELHSAFDQAERDEAVVLLTGRENCFSAGFDLKVFTEKPEDIVEMLILGATLCEKILAFPTPVVTACTGHALAAGTFLPLCADARLGATGPWKYTLNEVKIGLTVPLFVVELARQRLTPAEFSRAVVTAHTYSPVQAAAAGFIDQVVEGDELRDTALGVAEEMAGLNSEAHKATKLRVRGGAINAVREAIETELESVSA